MNQHHQAAAHPRRPDADYQLDFTTPGIIPDMDNSRKQIRHRWNLRIYPRGLPQRVQRLRTRVGYFRRVSRTIIDFLATILPSE
jgi:hypothetical protein